MTTPTYTDRSKPSKSYPMFPKDGSPVARPPTPAPLTPQAPRPPAPRLADVSPMAKTFASLGASATAEVDDVLTGSHPAVRVARNEWRKVSGLHQQLVSLLNGGDGHSNPIGTMRDLYSRPDLTEDGQDMHVLVRHAELHENVTNTVNELHAGLDAAEKALMDAALPPMPEGDSTARLIAREDAKLALDAQTSIGGFTDRAVALLNRAIDNNDAATVHLLASDWLGDYATSKFPNKPGSPHTTAEVVRGLIELALDEHAPADVAEVRQALRRLTGPGGPAVSIRALLTQTPKMVDDIKTRAHKAARG